MANLNLSYSTEIFEGLQLKVPNSLNELHATIPLLKNHANGIFRG